ncbi:MAG TPA: hypothetical protein H9772_13235 [Candidatus Oscillibacter pullicola]|nr:hypothetical protein [Candidatus Oscillibacter pullicola]
MLHLDTGPASGAAVRGLRQGGDCPGRQGSSPLETEQEETEEPVPETPAAPNALTAEEIT